MTEPYRPLPESMDRRGWQDPDEFRARLIAEVRHILAWLPEMSHASVSRIDAEGRTWTAYGRREGPADTSAWIREGGGEPGEDHERLDHVVAHERYVREAAERKRARRKREPDPRIWGPIREED